MAFQQTQWYCNLCQRYTLHTGNCYEVPHLLHLIVTLFLCGFWFPIWVLHCLINAGSRADFRCTQCGQLAGTLTPEQEAARARHQAEERYRRQEEAADRSIERRKQREAAMVATKEISAKGAELLMRQAKALPGDIDYLLQRAAGEENMILLWFFRVCFVAASLALPVGAGFLLVSWLL